MNDRQQSIENVKNLGYPVYMDSEYCKEHINKHGNCKNCEYDFSCNEVLLDMLRTQVNMLKEKLIEAGKIPESIDLNDCKIHRNIFNGCKSCKNEEKCYKMALEWRGSL